MEGESLYEQGLQKFRDKVIGQGRIHDANEQRDLEEFLAKSSSPEDALKESEQIKTDAHKKWGGIKIDGKVKVSETWVSNIMSNIQNFVAVGDFVMKKAPESIGAAWFGVSLALSAIQNNYALYSIFGTGLTDMTELMVTIRHYDSLYHQRRRPGVKLSDNSVKLFDNIADTYAAMLDFAFSVHRHLSGSGWAKIRHGFKDFFAANGKKFQDKAALMATCKKKMLEGTQGAFQEKTFQQFDDVRDALQLIQTNVTDMQKFQRDAQMLQQAQLEMQDEWTKAWSEVKETMKPRSRWDFAAQQFGDIKKLLRPLDRTTDPLFESLDVKLPGTCEWLFKQPAYTSWLGSTDGSILCITGQNGVGKSVLAATAFEAIDRAIDDSTAVVLFFSCELPNSSGSDNSPRSFNALRNSLIFQLYELAIRDETNPTLLENCNKIFENPKNRKNEKSTKLRKQDDTMPDLPEALIKLSAHLRKDVIIILDAVDRLPDDDQTVLHRTLNEFQTQGTDAEEARTGIRTLVTCKSGVPFWTCFSRESMIDMEPLNREDIRSKLDAELTQMGAWNESDKTSAIDAVMTRAGPKFDYVTQVAIPFLKVPFRGPVSERFKQLPRGIEETYEQALSTMQPDYLELLRCALSFVLFSEGPVKAIEVMDTFSEIFQSDADLTSFDGSKVGEFPWTRAALDIEVEQLKAAAGPFLNVWKSVVGEWMVELKDTSQAINFFLDNKTVDRVQSPEGDSETLCARCRTKPRVPKSMFFSRKEGHLRLALTCVKHLQNPSFWRRYYPMLDSPVATSAPANVEEATPVSDQDHSLTDRKPASVDGDQSQPHVEAREATDEVNHEPSLNQNTERVDAEPAEHEDAIASSGVSGTTDQVDVASKLDDPISTEIPSDAKPADDSGYDTDESQDDDDRGAFTFKTPSAGVEQVNEGSGQLCRMWRYEMQFWKFHIKQAEALWTSEERVVHPVWKELMAELDFLAYDRPTEFTYLQRMLFVIEDIDTELYGADSWMREAWTPLHIASLLGLTSWAEHLIDDRHESLELQCESRTPLQAAAKLDGDPGILRLLLEKGADPNFGTAERMPACYSWIWANPTYECMELFKRHKADFSVIEPYNTWSALHYFADAGEDVKVLDLLLSEDDNGRKPDINATDNLGETPLHVLLHRRDVPITLLNAFIDYGAHVNLDDKASERPLQEACAWGNDEIVRILLPHVTDIDDGDRRGRTALHQAAWDGSLKCVQLLLDKTYNGGADPHKLDGHGRTPFFFACLGSLNQQGRSEETAKFLLTTLRQRDYSVTSILTPTLRNRTPLRQAAGRGYKEVVQAILEMLAASDGDFTPLINAADSLKHRTALHCAAFYGRVECVALLLAHAADPSPRDLGGKTALELSYEQWNLSADAAYEDIIAQLVAADPPAAIADPELASYAAANGSVRLLRQLDDLRAPLDRPDRYGWTPLMLARRFGHTAAVELIDRAFLTRGDKLPSKWIDVPSNIEVSADGLGLKHAPLESGEMACVSTDIPIPSEVTSFYFEVTLKEREKGAETEDPAGESPTEPEFTNMAVGFCTLGAAAITYPGWRPRPQAPTARSWGYHGDDGAVGASSSGFTADVDRRYGPGVTVGCGVNFDTGKIWFTRDGTRLEESFSEGVKGRLFPLVGFTDEVEIRTNFGSRPFLWREVGDTDKVEKAGVDGGMVEVVTEIVSAAA